MNDYDKHDHATSDRRDRLRERQALVPLRARRQTSARACVTGTGGNDY